MSSTHKKHKKGKRNAKINKEVQAYLCEMCKVHMNFGVCVYFSVILAVRACACIWWIGINGFLKKIQKLLKAFPSGT